MFKPTVTDAQTLKLFRHSISRSRCEYSCIRMTSSTPLRLLPTEHALTIGILATSEKSCWCLTDTGAVKGYSAVYLGASFRYLITAFAPTCVPDRFGLLHRIPPLPENREPGALPLELSEPSEEYDEQQVFVPADVADGMETPEHAQERMRWEQEEYERAQYATSYAQHAHNQSSPSAAYDPSPERESPAPPSRPSGDAARIGAPAAAAPAPVDEKRTPHASPVPESVPSAVVQASQTAAVILSRPSTPVRSPSFPIPRSATPTQSRPLGYHMNGEHTTPLSVIYSDVNLFSLGVGIRPRTPSWDTRMFDLGSRDSEPSPLIHDAEDGESVAGTETTDVSSTSEETSQGSLTSVD